MLAQTTPAPIAVSRPSRVKGARATVIMTVKSRKRLSFLFMTAPPVRNSTRQAISRTRHRLSGRSTRRSPCTPRSSPVGADVPQHRYPDALKIVDNAGVVHGTVLLDEQQRLLDARQVLRRIPKASDPNPINLPTRGRRQLHPLDALDKATNHCKRRIASIIAMAPPKTPTKVRNTEVARQMK